MMFTFSLFVCWQLDVYVWQVGSINSVTSLTWDRGQFFMHSALQLMAGFRRVIDAGRQKAFGRVCCWLESQWHVCSWAQQSASRGHAWVSWATPYASEMAALIVNDACCCSSGWPLSNIRLPQRSLHQSCSLTSSTPTMVQAAQLYHCIHHFVASTVGCAQRWQNYAFSSSVFHSSIGIDCIASLIDWCTSAFGDG